MQIFCNSIKNYRDQNGQFSAQKLAVVFINSLCPGLETIKTYFKPKGVLHH